MGDVKKSYEKLEKKYRLPRLELLVKEFGVKLEKPELILRDIIEKIEENLIEMSEILESIIFIKVGSKPSSLYEAKMLEKREYAFELYKQLMSFIWKGKRVKISSEESMKASFIKETYEEWDRLKTEFMKICEVFERKWKEAKLRESPSTLAYHG